MGIGTNAFKREIGKNTGKWISNVVFGDSHSTPYRRVGSNREPREVIYREPRISKTEQRHQQFMAQLERENSLKERIYEEQQDAQRQKIHLEFLNEMQQNIKVALALSPTDYDNYDDYINEIISWLELKEWVNLKDDYLFDKFEKSKFTIENRLADIYLDKLRDFIKNLPETISIEKEKELRKTLLSFEKKRASALKDNWGAFDSYLMDFKEMFVSSVFSKKRTIKSENLPTSNILNKVEVSKNKEEISIENDTENCVEESIFIDLNEENRIEKKLSDIWTKYEKLIDYNIINRKPIFSSDAVKDSILFIGVNPSYNPADDEILIKSSDNKSLMYGSLYQLPNAPAYFKKLETFADNLGVGYSHINLLYARENDRNLLLNVNHNFIREQLELTYETILLIKPIAILFFSDYSKDLIYGKDRWVNPILSTLDCHVLNGTNIPVFFTDDITILEQQESQLLLNSILKAIK